MTSTKKNLLGTAISISKGKKHSIADEPSEKSKRLLGIDDLRNDNLLRYTDDKSGTEVVPEDVLIAWDGANAGTIGYGKSGFIGSTISRLRIREKNKHYAPFLGSFLQSKFGYLRQTATGATIPHINRKALENITLPEIELDDQIRIAHLLCKVEGLVAQRKQNLQQLDDLLKSVFLEMFGDPITNIRSFPSKKLSEFYINPKEGTKCGPFGSALKKDELVESGVPVWNMDNIDPTGRMVLPFRMWITEEKYQALRSYSVLDGDIIISRAGTVGKMCVAKMNGAPAVISTNLIRLRLGPKLRPLHIVSLMTYCKGRIGRLKTGPDGAFTHMNTGILDKLEFPYPPIDLQNQFADIVEKVEGIKFHYQQSLTELVNLYGALSQKAFKGVLDLSRVPLSDDDARPVSDNLKHDILNHLKSKSDKLDIAPKNDADQTEFFHTWTFHKFLRARKDEVLTTTDLWEALEQKNFNNPPPSFESFKTWVLTCLEQKKWLEQVYGEVSADKNKIVKEKKIALRIRDDS